jgi:hypothetical protein
LRIHAHRHALSFSLALRRKRPQVSRAFHAVNRVAYSADRIASGQFFYVILSRWSLKQGGCFMSLILKRPVVVKHIVTEAFKQKAFRDIETTLEQIEQNLAQIEFQGRRMIAELERQAPSQAVKIREELKREKQRQESLREELYAKRAQIDALQVDTTFIAGTYEAPVQLSVGEHFGEKMRQAEILIKDDIIVEIRQ